MCFSYDFYYTVAIRISNITNNASAAHMHSSFPVIFYPRLVALVLCNPCPHLHFNSCARAARRG